MNRLIYLLPTLLLASANSFAQEPKNDPKYSLPTKLLPKPKHDYPNILKPSPSKAREEVIPRIDIRSAFDKAKVLNNILKVLEGDEIGVGSTLPSDELRFRPGYNHGFWAAEVLFRSGVLTQDEMTAQGMKFGQIGGLVDFLKQHKSWEECKEPVPGALAYIHTDQGLVERTNALAFVGRDKGNRVSVAGQTGAEVTSFNKDTAKGSSKFEILAEAQANDYFMHAGSGNRLSEGKYVPLRYVAPSGTCL